MGFWAWVIANPKVAVILTEGVKKAAALLSLGFAAIGLPGIWGGYRKNNGQHQRQGSMGAGRRGETGTKLEPCPSLGVLEERGFPPAPCPVPPCLKGQPSLLPQLEVFAHDGRQFYFAFDQDEKPKTRFANSKALRCTARLLQNKDCLASIIRWEPWIKGCDDLIVAKGANYFVECYEKALTFEDWQADQLKELTYKPALRLDSSTKYIGEFAPPPSAKLICLKAPKGSGKTEWLVKVCEIAQNQGSESLGDYPSPAVRASPLLSLWH